MEPLPRRRPGDQLSGEEGALVQLTDEQADLAHPQWLFGGATYAFLDDGAIACVRTEGAEERLGAARAGAAANRRDLGLPFTSFGFPALSARGERVAFAAASPESETAVVVYDVAGGETEVVRTSSDEPVDPAYVSRPRAIEFPTGEGEVAHGFYYPPTNPEFEAPEGELPPLIVESHGGPTSHVTPALDREFLYWTSRGFGVVDVNYRGSSGYGRAYRDRLQRRPGAIVDTEDCVARGAPTSPRRARPTASGWRSAAARPAATRPSARSSSTTSSPPAPATTASPTPRRSPATPTSSSRATSTG